MESNFIIKYYSFPLKFIFLPLPLQFLYFSPFFFYSVCPTMFSSQYLHPPSLLILQFLNFQHSAPSTPLACTLLFSCWHVLFFAKLTLFILYMLSLVCALFLAFLLCPFSILKKGIVSQFLAVVFVY